MKVKIEKSSEPFFWYAKHIGEFLNVQPYNQKWYKVKDGKHAQFNVLKSDVSKVDERGVPHSQNETIRVPPNFHPERKQKQNTNRGMMILLFMIFVTQLAIVGTGVWYAMDETERDQREHIIHQLKMELIYYEQVNHKLFRKCKECDVSDYWINRIETEK
jgi:hypothetical protein